MTDVCDVRGPEPEAPSTRPLPGFQSINRGYDQVFQSGRLSLGLVVPLENYSKSSVPDMTRHVERVRLAEELGFAAIWLRDVPFDVPSFGDAGQTYDPFVYLGHLAAATERIALVTGANSGLGAEITRGLVRAGLSVLMACRDVERGEAARAAIAARAPDARVEVVQLDLADVELEERHGRPHGQLDREHDGESGAETGLRTTTASGSGR